MIAKLVAVGQDRAQATDRLGAALDAFHIAGGQHNIAFLAAIAASDRFRHGALSTDFIAEEFPNGFGAPAELTAADDVILTAAALAETRLHESEIAGNGVVPSAPSQASRRPASSVKRRCSASQRSGVMKKRWPHWPHCQDRPSK